MNQRKKIVYKYFPQSKNEDINNNEKVVMCLVHGVAKMVHINPWESI